MTGFNIAEATNFVSERWIPAGILAKHCNCRPSSVTLDAKLLETHILRDKKQRTLRLTDQSSLVSCESFARGLFRCSCMCERMEFKASARFPQSYQIFPTCSNDRPMCVGRNTWFDAIKAGVLFQCCECDCWCHTACFVHSSTTSRCHYCRRINETNNNHRGTCSGEETLIDEHCSNPTSSSGQKHIISDTKLQLPLQVGKLLLKRDERMEESSVVIAKAPSPSKKRKAESNVVVVGDSVIVRLLDASVEGVVTDLAEGSFRLHVSVIFFSH